MRQAAVILAVALLVGGATIAWLLLPQEDEGLSPFLGYVEAETILVAPKQTGRLIKLPTIEGMTVAAGEPLFALDSEDEEAAVAEAVARLARARAELADLHAARRRPAEIDMLEARRRQAETALDWSRAELQRQQKLFRQSATPVAQLDQARTDFRRNQGALAEIEQEIKAARLPGREAKIRAAEAEVVANAAVLDRARIALAERKVAAPQGGRVLDVLYRAGEMVPAGQAVIEILPPQNIVVRFYVPETMISDLVYGQRVAIACDGCPSNLTGRISFIASEAEFTPPVIFSRQERAKLIFLVKARPTAPTPFLKPGLPVEVRPL